MNKKGFTLIEVVVATLIVALLAGGMLGAFFGARRFGNLARRRIQAFNFAREALDRMRANCEYDDDIIVGGSVKVDTEIGKIALGTEMTSFGAAVTYTVSAEPVSGSYKPVTVKVTWNEPSLL